MRVRHAIWVASVVSVVLAAAACGDDTKRTVARGDAGSGGGDAGQASSSGGSANEPGEEGGAGGNVEPGTSGAAGDSGGESNCPVGPQGTPPDDYLAEFASGTRLEARYYASQGMPDVFAGFFDTDLNEWCDFMLASDDTLRCLPRSTANLGHLGYADLNCEEDVWQFSPGCVDAPGYVRQRLECADKAEVRLLEVFTGSLRFGSPDNCDAGEDPADPDSYTAGAEVPPTSFVEGELVDVPGVCRAALRVVQAVDGARAPFHAFDIASDADCDPRFGGCRPLRLAFEEPELFGDDVCETEADAPYATWLDAATCAPPDFVRPLMPLDIWYRPGPVAEAELYSGIDGCEPILDKEWIGAVYELGEAVPSSDLAPLESVTLGTGPLQVVASAENGTPLLATVGSDQRFHHTQLDQACYLRQLSDGSLRCLATDIVSGTGIVDEYNDAACTEPLRRCQGDDCLDKLLFDDAVDDQACSSERTTTALWRITAAGTDYYRRFAPAGPCIDGGTVQPDMWTVEPVDPSELPEATLETAP